jgi:hypothetical protein
VKERVVLSVIIFAFAIWGQSSAPPKNPSAWWVHGPEIVHTLAAAVDGLSSWKQPEANPMYVTRSGYQAGNFYRLGAQRMTAITLGVVGISELLGHFRPRWRKYVGALNLGMAAAHIGIGAYNVARNPYYQ